MIPLTRAAAQRAVAAAALIGAGALGGCEPVAPSTDVLFTGCYDVTMDAVCQVRHPATLTAWFARGAEPVRVDGRTVEPPAITRTQIDGGERMTLNVPRDARRVELGRGLSLAIAQAPRHPELAATGDLDERAALDRLEALAQREALAADAYSALARRHLGAGRLDDGMRALRLARDAYRQRGLWLSAMYESSTLSYHLLHRQRDFSGAAAELEHAERSGIVSADERYFLAYHRALIAFNSGDARRALRQLEAAATLTRRLGWTRRQAHVDQILAVQLQMLGRRRDATRLLADWSADQLDATTPCERAMLVNNRGWSTLLEREAVEAAADPTDELERARRDADEHCPVSEQANVRINLALAALQRNDTQTAQRYLDESRAGGGLNEPRLVNWAHIVEARIAHRLGDVDRALALYATLATRSADEGAFAMQWRATVGRARALVTAGRIDDALRSFDAARALVSGQIERIPLTEGRESFLAQHDAAWREHVALLLRSGADDTAFQIVRDAKRQTRQGLRLDQKLLAMDAEALGRWHDAVGAYRRSRDALSETAARRRVAPSDQLARLADRQTQQRRATEAQLDAVFALATAASPPRVGPPDPDALTVAFVRLPTRWAVFATQDGVLTIHTLECETTDRGALADCLIAPLQPAILDARALHILAGDDDAALDLAAARLNGQPLIDHLPLRHRLDLPALAEATPSRRALVIADPDGSLTGARQEARAVTGLLRRDAWQLGPTQHISSAAALHEALAGASLFHFAGHARRAGVLGWDSALDLADGRSFRVGDILALDRVPRFVFLSGCDTGAQTQDQSATGTGLGEAFLMRGAQWVIATTRPVRDDTAQRLSTKFYAHWNNGKSPDDALRRAQLDVRERGGDWAAFRLLTR